MRFVEHSLLEATVFEMERLRCNACGEVFTADEPETAGPDKYDETAVAMIALLKYGTGVPLTDWKDCKANWECLCPQPHSGNSWLRMPWNYRETLARLAQPAAA